jgi:hypothetical protein
MAQIDACSDRIVLLSSLPLLSLQANAASLDC